MRSSETENSDHWNVYGLNDVYVDTESVFILYSSTKGFPLPILILDRRKRGRRRSSGGWEK
jgi:hypothetical protein